MTDMDNKLQQKDIDFLKEGLSKLEKTVSDGFAAMQAEMRILSEHYIRREELDRAISRVKEANIDPLREEVKMLTDNQTWLVRAVGGIVIVAFMGLIITNKPW